MTLRSPAMNRRAALFTTGSMIVSASLGSLACGGGHAVAQNTPKAPPSPPPPGHAHHHVHGNPELLEAAHACMAKGDACIAHCIMMLSSGDTSMADCAKTVQDMRATMVGLAALAASGNPRLPALARIALDLCKECEAACRKHADTHAVCRECADACARCVAACQKIAA